MELNDSNLHKICSNLSSFWRYAKFLEADCQKGLDWKQLKGYNFVLAF